jgi:hypothetical protein
MTSVIPVLKDYTHGTVLHTNNTLWGLQIKHDVANYT